MIREEHIKAQQDLTDAVQYLLFKIKDHLFAIRTTNVCRLQEAEKEVFPLPNAPAYVRGTFQSANDLFSVVDLRQLFGWATRQQELHEFLEMIEARKRDHVKWVDALKKSHCQKTPFMLSKNPHQCALGIWRDSYSTDIATIQTLLNHLDIPHGRLHDLADAALEEGDHANFAIKEVENKLMPEILAVLDEMKIRFQQQVFREMFILIQQDVNIALVVDQILGVESSQEIVVCKESPLPSQRLFIKHILQKSSGSELIMELDIDALIEQFA